MSSRFLSTAPLDDLRDRTSAKWRTYPADVLPLTVAEMDFDLAPPIATALRRAVERSDTGYGYAGTELGEALSSFADARWDWEVDPAQVFPVADVGVGIVELLRVLAGPDDVVVISPPVYPPFFEWAAEAGALLREVPLARGDDGWRLDLGALEEAFAEHPAVYLLCNPHNPVGRVHSPDELQALAGLAERYGVTVISDEIHAPLVLPGATFTPFLSVPGGAEVGIALQSASKAWNLAGLKCATIVSASRAMRAVVGRLPEELRWRIGQFGVLATVAAWSAGAEWLDDLLVTLDDRRALLRSFLATRLPELAWHAPEATYLAWIDCSAIGSGDGPRDLFLEKGGVAVEPGLRFGTEGSSFVRLNFGTSAEILDLATRGMVTALHDRG